MFNIFKNKNIEIDKLTKENDTVLGLLKKEQKLHNNVRFKLKSKQKEYVDLTNTLQRLQGQRPKIAIQKWAKSIKRGNVCDICSSAEKLSAHHVYPKNLYASLSLLESNGVCLCDTCHQGYHEIYGDSKHCNPLTYNRFKEDAQNKIKVKEYQKLSIWEIIKQPLRTI